MLICIDKYHPTLLNPLETHMNAVPKLGSKRLAMSLQEDGFTVMLPLPPRRPYILFLEAIKCGRETITPNPDVIIADFAT
nr:hypothetical protein HmN_000681900 [Hymenolepis microstoma]